MRAVSLGRLPAVVIRLRDGSLHALVNRCLHHGAPLSRGRLGPGSRGTGGVGDYSADESIDGSAMSVARLRVRRAHRLHAV